MSVVGVTLRVPATTPSNNVIARSTSSSSSSSSRWKCGEEDQQGGGWGGVAARVLAATALSASLLLGSAGASLARIEGVNRPELLPQGPVQTVIDVAGFLTPSEEKKLQAEVEGLESDTGFRLRVLAQSYPETPGLAVRDYWKVDDRSVVFVADPTFKNILNFNVGQAVDLEVPQSFWTRLAGKYGNKFYWQEKGEATSILDAVSAIDTCLREEPGRFKCSNVQGELGEQASSGSFGKFFGL